LRRATLIATLSAPPSASGAELAALAPAVGWLEVRADLVGDLDAAWLRARFSGPLLYTLRSRAEGGAGETSRERRRQRLAAAARHYDLVDLEAGLDLAPELLPEVPAERRLLSWHGPAAPVTGLEDRLREMSATPARAYKLVPAAAASGEELAPLLLLAGARRDDVAAFASGRLGAWTRLVAPRLGAPLVFGSLGDAPAAPGQPSVERLVADFGLPELPEIEALCGVAGDPVGHSLSPRLHNAAYRELGLPLGYLAFSVASFADFWLEVVESGALEALGLPLRGLSVTSPFKEAALAVAGAASPLAEQVAGANTLVRRDGVWEAEATDPRGVVAPLRAAGVELAGARAAVVGCGGAGRAAAVGLGQAGARVTLVNRDAERGRAVASRLRLPFLPLAEFRPAGWEVVVHATSLGRMEGDELPFAVAEIDPGTTVVDLVYGPQPTPLDLACRRRGLPFIEGREVLLAQAVEQFRLMTGRELPRERGRAALGLAPLAPMEPAA
jgi:3-dehydroquinate dehydratase/shikimate dehydrogenase